jgi:hypothetical protein
MICSKKGNKNGNELLKIKRKRKNSPSPCWAKSGPCRGRLLPPPRLRISPFGPLAGPLAREAARALPSLSLTDEPAPPASPSRSRAPPHWQTGPTGQLRHLPCVRRTAVPSIAVPSPIPSPHRKSSAPPRPHRLTNVLAQYRPAVESHRRRCAALMLALCTSPAPAELRRSPPLGRL